MRRIRHDVGGERTRRVGDVNDTGLECVADLERWHRLRPADVVDLNYPLAVRVDTLDERFESAANRWFFRQMP